MAGPSLEVSKQAAEDTVVPGVLCTLWHVMSPCVAAALATTCRSGLHQQQKACWAAVGLAWPGQREGVRCSCGRPGPAVCAVSPGTGGGEGEAAGGSIPHLPLSAFTGLCVLLDPNTLETHRNVPFPHGPSLP